MVFFWFFFQGFFSVFFFCFFFFVCFFFVFVFVFVFFPPVLNKGFVLSLELKCPNFKRQSSRAGKK